MGWLSVDAARGAVEVGVAEGEDAAVGRHEPVAVAVGRGGHADDGLVEVNAAGGAVELASPKAKTPPSEATSQ